MAENNKKSLSYKLQKNPFLLVLIIIVFAVLIFGFAEVTSKIQDKKQNQVTTTAPITETEKVEDVFVTEAEKEKTFTNVKKYCSQVGNISFETNESNVIVRSQFKNKDDVLNIHHGKNINNINVVPVFCFYLDDGTMVKCPGEIKIKQDFVAEYKLSEIDDFANVKALADEVTVNYENILDHPFNLYLLDKTTGEGESLFGTYKEKVETSLKTKGETGNVFNTATGVKKVNITATNDFVWVDIYYTDVESYTKLNNDFVTNFVCFGFESNGATYKRDFILTEYDSLNMVRCKFDSYSLNGLAKEMGVDDITVKELFSDYTISVWTTDYDKETNLFTING